MSLAPRFSNLVMPTVFGVALVLSLVRVAATATHEYFIEKPHLISTGSAGGSAMHWLSPDSDAVWTVRYRTAPGSKWHQVPASLIRRVPDEMRTHRLYEAVFDLVPAGQPVEVEVLRNGSSAFTMQGSSPVVAKSITGVSGL